MSEQVEAKAESNGKQKQVAITKLPESPASANFYAVGKKGWNFQFTLRDWDEGNLLVRCGELIKQLEAVGFMPKPVGQQPVTPVTAVKMDGEESSEDGKEYRIIPGPGVLAVEFAKGKKSYRWKGGYYKEFGVRVWPEVLPQLGLSEEQLEPGAEVDTKQKAAKILMEFDEDKTKKVPRKVVAFVDLASAS